MLIFKQNYQTTMLYQYETYRETGIQKNLSYV